MAEPDDNSRASRRTKVYVKARQITLEAAKLLVDVPTLSGPYWSFPEPLKARMAAVLKELDGLAEDYEWAANDSAQRSFEAARVVRALRRCNFPVEAAALEADWDDPRADMVRAIHASLVGQKAHLCFDGGGRPALTPKGAAWAHVMECLQALLVNQSPPAHEDLSTDLTNALGAAERVSR